MWKWVPLALSILVKVLPFGRKNESWKEADARLQAEIDKKPVAKPPPKR